MMKVSGKEIERVGSQTGSAPEVGDQTVTSPDALREWAKCVEQDSQAETNEYLGESVTAHSGE